MSFLTEEEAASRSRKAEFARLVALTGWNKSEVGRRIHMSHVAVGYILNPDNPTCPRAGSLELLKTVVVTEFPDALVARPAPEAISKSHYRGNADPPPLSDRSEIKVEKNAPLERAVRELREIAAVDPDKAKHITDVIATYRKGMKLTLKAGQTIKVIAGEPTNLKTGLKKKFSSDALKVVKALSDRYDREHPQDKGVPARSTGIFPETIPPPIRRVRGRAKAKGSHA